MRLIPSSRGGMLLRSLLAAMLVIGFAAGTTAVAGLLKFKQFANDLSFVKPLPRSTQVTIPKPGSAQTILLIGSDHRAGTPFRLANTDTMMLVRIDPNSKTINLLSVPRDLRVQIPGGNVLATNRLNAAYSIGGPNLLVKVLRTQVFHGLKINHIIDVNFGGFEAMINAIGCVYTDVDHRYYNNTAVTNYSSIDIQPGYQKLCGADALAFVRFRHTDSDLVRNARQQDFLRWAKAQYSPTQLASHGESLLKILGKHVSSIDHNLQTTDGLINLFDLVVFAAGRTVKQIPFPAIPLPCGPAPAHPAAVTAAPACYVIADSGAEQHTFHQFMTPTSAAPAPNGAPANAAGAGAPGGKPGPRGGATAPGLATDISDGLAQAKALGPIGIPIYFPKLIRSGSHYCSSHTSLCPLEYGAGSGFYPRAYLLHDRHGVSHYAYRMTLELNPVLGQYYGVQGTTWQNPPILSNPNRTRFVAGKQLMLYANGGKLSLVAWRTPQGVYWISNTLTDDLSNEQMIAIAASLTRAGGR